MLRLLLLLVPLLTASCFPAPLSPAEKKAYDDGVTPVWMSRWSSWGRQCDPHIPGAPPPVGTWLAEAEIDVYDFHEYGRHVCRACACSNGAAQYYILVPSEQAPRAETLGFQESFPPVP